MTTQTAKQPEMTPIRRRLTPMEASVYTGLSKNYLDKLRVKGGGPTFHKFGRRVFYSIDDIEAYLNARRYHSTSEYTDPSRTKNRKRKIQ